MASLLLLLLTLLMPALSPAPAALDRLSAPGQSVDLAPGTWLIRLDGGPPLRLGTVPDLAWSPSGSRLAVFDVEAETPPARPRAIRILDRVTGLESTVPLPERAFIRAPVWSPDGTRLAFILDQGAAPSALLVAGADGGPPRELLTGGVQTFAWSPDGRSLFALGVEAGRPYDGRPLLIDIETGAERVIDVGPEPGCRAGFAFSPDGQVLVSSGPALNQGCGDPAYRGVWRWDAATGRPSHLYLGSTGPPLWTVDGLAIVTALDPAARSPAERTVAIRAFPEGAGAGEVLAAGIPYPFTPLPPFVQVAGRTVLYATADCDAAAASTVTAGTAPRRLTSPAVYAATPRLSADAGTLAFVAAGEATSEVRLLDIATGSEHALLTGDGGYQVDGWSPDGRAIVVTVTAEQSRPCIP
jgi:dipeptidyl aminopeptidase/acylaminoacyl peptidase